jgi:Fur family transcriptional regulator, ferric uptake regulator
VDPRAHETASLRLRRITQRYTSQRRSLVSILGGADRPLSVPEILKKDRKLAQSSAYRNLAVLERAGVVHRVVASSEFSSYELAEDLGKHHHHLICSSCGRVEDFTLPAALERSATSALDRAASRSGYSVHAHRLDVIGLCRSCA